MSFLFVLLLAAPLHAGARLSGGLHLGVGYDDSLLQDASAVGGLVSEDAFDLSLRGRAWRDLQGSLAWHSALLTQPNAPSQDLSEHRAEGRLAWRLFDCVSPLAEGSWSLNSGQSSHALDSSQLSYGGGLRADLGAWGWVEGLAQNERRDFPNTDLDAVDQGGEARWDLDLGLGLSLQGRFHSAQRSFSERKDYASILLPQPGSTLRQDQVQDWQAALGWQDDEVGVQATVQGSSLRSNGVSIDFGPGQTEYRDNFPTGSFPNFFTDNVLEKDYFSNDELGGGLGAWWQLSAWRLSGALNGADVRYSGRIAKGADDKLLPGSPLRQDRVLHGALGVSYHWTLWAQDWDLTLNWQRWQASSNDFYYACQRDLTECVLGFLF